MSDKDDNQEGNNDLSIVDHIVGAAVAVGTGLPPQIQRSFWKAVGRIFTAGAEWPAKMLEGKGRIATARAGVNAARFDAEAADIRSQQKARELVNKESAKIAARQFASPDLADRAVEYHAAHIVRNQKRIEEILRIAADDITKNPPTEDSSNEIEDDVLETILREGSRRSSAEFKLLFGRILSGEIKSPGSFSIGTIQSIGRLTTETANIFQRLCNISTMMAIPGQTLMPPKVIENPFGQASQNDLLEVGVSYDDLAKLAEEGLIRTDFAERRPFFSQFYINKIPFEHAGRKFWVAQREAKDPPDAPDLQLTGPSFSKAGIELRQVVTMEPSQNYINKLADWFKTQNLTLYTVVREEENQLFGEAVRP